MPLPHTTEQPVTSKVQSGRQALLAKEYAKAVEYFEQAVIKDPNYVWESVHFREGIWTYLGRSQYATGAYDKARQSLELALSASNDDQLARLYLGLTLLKSGQEDKGREALSAAMKGLHDRIEDIERTWPHEALWDPGRDIRKELQRSLSGLQSGKADAASHVASGEWLGNEIEDAMERLRRTEHR